MNAPEQSQQNPALWPEIDEDKGLDLSRLIGVISEARWLVAGIAAGVFALGILYTLIATPIYQTYADLLVLTKQSGGLSGLEQFSAMLEGSSLPTETEIQLLQTRAVLVPVVEKLHLNLKISRNQMPFVGWLLGSYGKPRIDVSVFKVPIALEGKAFTLDLTGGQTFQLFDFAGNKILDGQVGIAASGEAPTGYGYGIVTIKVADLGGETGSFNITHIPTDQAVQSVLNNLDVKEMGLQTGMVRASLEGPSPPLVERELNEIAEQNVRQNARRSAIQAANQLQFLKAQLPDVENRVRIAQKKLSDFLSTHHTLVISQDATYLTQQAAALEQQIGPLQAQIAEAKAALGTQNPQLTVLHAQLNAFEQQRANLFAGISKLPEDQQALIRLQSDATIAQTLYQAVLDQMQTLQIAQAGAVGDVVVVDPAIVPVKPVLPNRPRDLGLALVLGLVGGVGAAFTRRALRKGIEDPEVLDTVLGLPVYAVISHSRAQSRMERGHSEGHGHTLQLLAAQSHEADTTVEGLKSLRTAIQLDLSTSGRRVVCFCSLGPREGKSFVSSNLAYLFAQSGLRVLIVDADMRRGHLHKSFSVERAPGLADILADKVKAEEAIHKTLVENLDLITTGALPADAANLLVNSNIAALIERLAERYDWVIVDVPPVLAVSDAFLIARHATLNLLLLKHGLHNERQVQLVQKRFERHGIRFSGSILNNVTAASRRYAYYYYGYRYHYKYKPKEKG